MYSRFWWMKSHCKRKNRGTTRPTPQEYRVAPHVRTSLLTRCRLVEWISAVSRRGLLNLHFICFGSGCPLFWHVHMQRECRVLGISHESAARFLRNRITACDACPARSTLLTNPNAGNKRIVLSCRLRSG